MKIRIEMENKELYSYADLAEQVGCGDASTITKESMKNVSMVSKKFAVKNTRDEENEIIVSEMEISADLIVKIVRKFVPIINALKMVWGMITNLFEDVTEELGDEDEWDVSIEGYEPNTDIDEDIILTQSSESSPKDVGDCNEE